MTSTGNGYSAAYDAAGNMTCRAPSSATICSGTQTGQQLSYDAEGNLSTWQNQPSPTSTVNYLYDGEGIRVAQQVSSGSNTTLTSSIGQLETVITGSSTSTTTYYSTGGLRIAEAVNGTFSYLGNDVLGSTAVALNASGQLTAAQLYGPYGNVRYSSGTMPTDIGFTGQRGDSATGLDYYDARYYDPVVGLFISADTVLPGGGFDPWGLSRYAYVKGNPETMTDPTGRRWASADGSETAWRNPVAGGLYTSTKESWIYGGGYKIDYYTPKELKNPWYDPLKDTQNSTGAKIKQSLGVTDLQKTWNDPHASAWDKTVAVGQMLWKNANNLMIAGMILEGPEDDAILATGEDLPWAVGGLFERTFETAKGPVGMLAEVAVQEDTVILKNIAVYNSVGEAFTGLTKDVLAARTTLGREFAAMGFKKLIFQGVRVAGSTSANPGKIVEILVDLTKYADKVEP